MLKTVQTSPEVAFSCSADVLNRVDGRSAQHTHIRMQSTSLLASVKEV